MNIFKHYLSIIKNSILAKKNLLNLNEIDDFKGLTLESPPSEFDFDLSCNVSLILAKKNNQIPKELAKNIKSILLKDVEDFTNIEIAGPGFLNIKFSKRALKKIVAKYLMSKNSNEVRTANPFNDIC